MDDEPEELDYIDPAQAEWEARDAAEYAESRERDFRAYRGF